MSKGIFNRTRQEHSGATFFLKHYETRRTPEKRDRKKDPRHGQHPERDQNRIQICIIWGHEGTRQGSMPVYTNQKYPQYCCEFHDQLWEALSGTNSEKKRRPQPYWGGRILETLWKPQMPWIIGLGAFQPYSRGKFQETLWERFRGLSGIFPEFLPESPSRTSGEKKTNKHKQLRGIVPEMGGGQIVYVFPLFLRKKGNT